MRVGLMTLGDHLPDPATGTVRIVERVCENDEGPRPDSSIGMWPASGRITGFVPYHAPVIQTSTSSTPGSAASAMIQSARTRGKPGCEPPWPAGVR